MVRPAIIWTESVKLAGQGAEAWSYIVYEASMDFGVVDEKGRAIGCTLTVCDYSSSRIGTQRGIMSRVQSTRNGKKFGAMTTPMNHENVSLAKESAEFRAGASRARAQRIARERAK